MSEYYFSKDELYHHGIKGQKWGIRRWQNEDGSLTAAGKQHYGYGVLGSYRLRNAEKTANSDQYRRARKDAKAAYKKAINASYDRESKFETEVEKKYKRGQKLSEKDFKKEQDYYDKESLKRQKAKLAYKQAKRQATADYNKRERLSAEKAIKNTSYKKIGATAAAGVAAMALGTFLSRNSKSYGMQLVGSALAGGGYGTAMASGANALYKAQYNKSKKNKSQRKR